MGGQLVLWAESTPTRLCLGNLLDLRLEIIHQSTKVQSRQSRLERFPNIRADRQEPQIDKCHDCLARDSPPAHLLIELKGEEEEVRIGRKTSLEGGSSGRLGGACSSQVGEGGLEGKEGFLGSGQEGVGDRALSDECGDAG